MKRLVFLASVLGTAAAFVAGCFLVMITLLWLVRIWSPAPWVVGVSGIGLLAATIVAIWRWWRLTVERRFRFSMRGMLVGITLFALWFGVVGVDVLRWGRQAAVVRELAGQGVRVNHYLSVTQEWAKTRELLDGIFGYNPFLEARSMEIRRDQGLPALLEYADAFQDLETVNFWGGGISDSGLEHAAELDRFPMLRTGLLYGCKVTDSGLERLTDWRGLKSLYLHNCGKITDRGLAHLHELPNLEFLRLLQEGGGAMFVTDAGMANVADLHRLRELQILNVPISDAGIAQLQNMPNLERLHLRGTKATEDGIRALIEALPDCHVTWDEASLPAVSQIRKIEIWTRERPERQIATIGERERITAIKVWFDQYIERFRNAGWRQDGPAGCCLSVRFEGGRRELCEIGLGNGVCLWCRGVYRVMLPADEKEIRTLLGVDGAEWYAGGAVD